MLAAVSYTHLEEGLSEKSIKEEPLGELDDAFARIELKLVAQSA